MKNQLISASDFANAIKNTVYLFKNTWKEHTTLLLHAPQSVDKTEKALDIIAQVATPARPVVYINTGNSLDTCSDRVSTIGNLSVFTPAYDSSDDTRDYADLVIESIEEIVAETGIRTFVIDSISRIAALSFGRNSSPAYIMKRLAIIQLRLQLSLLVIAHDTTKSADRALLTLADSEIIPDPDETVNNSADAPDQPEASDKSEKSDQPDKPRRQLTRRDRRLLRRAKMQKI